MSAAFPPLPRAGDQARHDRQLVEHLQDSPLFREYRAAFQTATGLPLLLRAAGSFLAPLAGTGNVNPFCAVMAARSKSCSVCLELQQRVETELMGESKTLECFAGLSESMVPVRVGDRIVGYLQTGQVMFRPPTAAKFRAAIRQLARRSAIGDVQELKAAYFQTRVLARPHYEATVRLLSSFAQHLALLSNEVMINEATAEPPAVHKARAFITEHLGEPLSLTQVAQAANTSAFHFCKIFKAAVGLTFTDYLARTRVEKTKQLLLNANARVSEAAFEAGFQSLSQFNRVFRRVTGESPSHYRDQRRTTARRAPLPFAA